MLKIEHLSKTYGDKKAVDDLNLHIAPGEIYGFIGHNGAGKTTTLKSVAGILQFDTGEIYIDGQSIQQLLANATVYGAQIKGTAYPVYLFGSVGVGDVRASIIVSAAVAALFGLMWLLLFHSFLQIATATGKVARREHRETRSRQRSTNTALLCREFSRFAASPSYMLNCGLGLFLMLLALTRIIRRKLQLRPLNRAKNPTRH